MKYAIDCEFIDTPYCSALISLAIVNERMESRYFEFEYPEQFLTDWLQKNVVPNLTGHKTSFAEAAKQIEKFLEPNAEFWCYYGAYDWYWFCRLWGGFMAMPLPATAFHELAHLKTGICQTGNVHNALDDAKSVMIEVLALR